MEMIKQRHNLLIAMLLLLICTALTAQIPSKPVPPRLVNDFTNTLSYDEIDKLERMLVAYNDSTSTQITVVLVDDLQGYDIGQYAIELGHAWGVGQTGKDNGAVILVKPKTDQSQGRATVRVGYGLEQYVTDAACNAIIQKEMIPAFKENDYYTGIRNAANVIMDLCSGKFSADDYAGSDGFPLWLIILFIVALIIIFSSSNSNQNYSGGGTRTIWIPMGGGFGGGDFGGGGFGGGGFGGGGFGGFGGGGFGGGGASGSW